MTENSILKDKKHIHFIGIGGSGMYPLAQILHHEGYYITGSDNNETDTLAAVRGMGIPVMLGQRAENIEGADLIVHTAAIMNDNPELIAARASGVPVLERCELLGIITRRYDRAICISGTHGKTTTSSILTQILMEAKVDPTAVIGGKLPLIGGSGRAGSSDIMVCESCEYVDTFLHLAPDIAVILNIDRDHMEYFKTLERLIGSFRKFAEMATKSLIVNGDDANTMQAVAGLHQPTVTFGWSEKNDYYPANVGHAEESVYSYDLMHRGEKLCEIRLYVPGKHNILNSMAAAVAALEVGVTPEQVAQGVADFRGAGRRFEILGSCNGATVADDYAHHPAELKVT
ncbi:MAG: UDP-N-acetylmuramate--L-alanine ligase, partial [Oscillospiraceae bacterium]|nr:UDP-N-acetylmuramate--L-alanine ligase [Oscillospiraceae bacterium]